VPVYLPPYSGLAIVGFVFAALWLCGLGSLVGLGCGILGYRECVDRGKRGKGLAIAAIVLGAFGTLTLMASIVIVA
jgi:hypothetical protein